MCVCMFVWVRTSWTSLRRVIKSPKWNSSMPNLSAHEWTLQDKRIMVYLRIYNISGSRCVQIVCVRVCVCVWVGWIFTSYNWFFHQALGWHHSDKAHRNNTGLWTETTGLSLITLWLTKLINYFTKLLNNKTENLRDFQICNYNEDYYYD